LYRFGAVDATIGAEVARLSAPKSSTEGRKNFATPSKKWGILAKKAVMQARNQCRPMGTAILAQHVRCSKHATNSLVPETSGNEACSVAQFLTQPDPRG
jgi:gas vesicle protein